MRQFWDGNYKFIAAKKNSSKFFFESVQFINHYSQYACIDHHDINHSTKKIGFQMRKYIYNTKEKHNTHTQIYIKVCTDQQLLLLLLQWLLLQLMCVHVSWSHSSTQHLQTKSVLQMTTELQFKGRITWGTFNMHSSITHVYSFYLMYVCITSQQQQQQQNCYENFEGPKKKLYKMQTNHICILLCSWDLNNYPSHDVVHCSKALGEISLVYLEGTSYPWICLLEKRIFFTLHYFILFS
jgi:hypothetical protein